MIVEVVTGQIGEHPGREDQTIESPLVEAMRRRLHGDVGRASCHQLGQRCLKIDWARCSERSCRRNNRVARSIERAQRADASGSSVLVEEMLEEAGGGGLAVGAGHTEESKPPCRVVVPCGTEGECGTPSVTHNDFWYAGGLRLLDDDRRSAPPYRVRDVAVAVGLGATNGDVEHPACNEPAVDTDPVQLRKILRRRNEEIVSTESIEQGFTLHRLPRPSPDSHSLLRRDRSARRGRDLERHAKAPPVQRQRRLAYGPSRNARHG